MALPEYVTSAITAPMPPPGNLGHTRPSWPHQRQAPSQRGYTDLRAESPQVRSPSTEATANEGGGLKPPERTVAFGMPGDR